jgi:hypothetical protein
MVAALSEFACVDGAGLSPQDEGQRQCQSVKLEADLADLVAQGDAEAVWRGGGRQAGGQPNLPMHPARVRRLDDLEAFGFDFDEPA